MSAALGSHPQSLVPPPPQLCDCVLTALMHRQAKEHNHNLLALTILTNPSQQSYKVGTATHLRKEGFSPKSSLLDTSVSM